MIRYEIDVAATDRHTFAVELRVDRPAAEQRLSLPAWIPGSYLVREFARHLSALAAEQGGAALAVQQLDKATWRVRCDAARPLVVRYRVYAFDTSVRAAFLDRSRGFFNGTGICLRVEGNEASPHVVALAGLPDGWEIATTLEPRADDAGLDPPAAAGAREFVAADYDTLVDHPVELGRFWRGRFDAAGTAHEFVVAGAWPSGCQNAIAVSQMRRASASSVSPSKSGKAPATTNSCAMPAASKPPRQKRPSSTGWSTSAS